MTSYSSVLPSTSYSALMNIISSDPRRDRSHNFHFVGEETKACQGWGLARGQDDEGEEREARCSGV